MCARALLSEGTSGLVTIDYLIGLRAYVP